VLARGRRLCGGGSNGGGGGNGVNGGNCSSNSALG